MSIANRILLQLFAVLTAALPPAIACAATAAATNPGERMYRDGLLADGRPLVGDRLAGGALYRRHLCGDLLRRAAEDHWIAAF